MRYLERNSNGPEVLMLEQLFIKNYALADELTVDFGSGFNILSGETGAGKSVIIGALNLVLGEKGDVSVIRTGSDENRGFRCSKYFR